MRFTKQVVVLTHDVDQLTLNWKEQPLTFRQVLNLWATNPEFRKFYWRTLIELGGKGCFWEHPRLNQQTVNQPYECVITRTKAFTSFTANRRPFDDVFESGKTVSNFLNLSGSAWLIVPNPIDDNTTDCRDLITFCRSAPDELLHAFWSMIGEQTAKAIAEEAEFQFLSTHGLGVLWLHVRFEVRPKYYHHGAYKE